MKTTIDIASALLDEARRIAARQKTTIKALVEEGLRRTLAERRNPKPFKLPDKSVKGTGLQPDFADYNWEKIRDAIYEGRGA